MRRSVPVVVMANLAMISAAVAQTGNWRIEDVPVPMDGTPTQHCLPLEVPAPQTCSAIVRTDFVAADLLPEEYATSAELEITGLDEATTSTGICTVASNSFDDSCLALNHVEFIAEGVYEVCLTLSAFPAEDLGWDWDNFGQGREASRDASRNEPTAQILHTSVLIQDCGNHHETDGTRP